MACPEASPENDAKEHPALPFCHKAFPPLALGGGNGVAGGAAWDMSRTAAGAASFGTGTTCATMPSRRGKALNGAAGETRFRHADCYRCLAQFVASTGQRLNRMIHVREIDDIEQLAGYRLHWQALLGQTPGATFLHSLDWLEIYWRHFGHGQRLRVLLVYHDGSLLGILPLTVKTEATRLGGVRVLTYPLDGWGTFYGPIGPNPAATLTAGLEHIRRSPRDWDLLDLRWVDREGTDRGRTANAFRLAGLPVQRQAWEQAPLVTVADTWESYWRSRKKHWRQNVGRLQRRLGEQGRVRLLRYRPEGAALGDDDPRWDLYDACVELARCSWQGASTSGTTLCHPCVCCFLRDVHATAARCGALDMNLLLLDERPVAFVYNYQYQGRAVGLRKGHDPAVASFGPGTVLQRLMLEDSFRRGDVSYDFGVGSLACKRYWQTSLATSYRYAYAPALAIRPRLLRWKRWLDERRQGPGYMAAAQA